MKPLKLEPYQRSRHRAALHAWVVAATAVTSVGMPALALDLEDEQSRSVFYQTDLSPSLAAQRTAADWLGALSRGDRDTALSAMRLPSSAAYQPDVVTEVDALAALISMDAVTIEPVAHKHAGHWALSAWRIQDHSEAHSISCQIEPITLYHPASDEMFDDIADWQVVLPGFEDDPALAPLYNADHAVLMDWYQTLV